MEDQLNPGITRQFSLTNHYRSSSYWRKSSKCVLTTDITTLHAVSIHHPAQFRVALLRVCVALPPQCDLHAHFLHRPVLVEDVRVGGGNQKHSIPCG